jgi:hypothetical protein
MHKNATKCNETICKWCKNKHGASKIIDTFETYHRPPPTAAHRRRYRRRPPPSSSNGTLPRVLPLAGAASSCRRACEFLASGASSCGWARRLLAAGGRMLELWRRRAGGRAQAEVERALAVGVQDLHRPDLHGGRARELVAATSSRGRLRTGPHLPDMQS